MNNQQAGLPDAVLLAYIEGAVDAATERQIEADAANMARVRWLLQQQQATMHPIQRPLTLDGLTLGAYHLDLLPSAAANVVADQLAQEPGWRAERRLLQRYLDDLAGELPPLAVPGPTAPSPLQQLAAQVRTIIATLTPAPAPTFALLGDTDEQQIYTVGDLQIMLQVQDDETLPHCKAIYGLISGIADDRWQVSLTAKAQPGALRPASVTTAVTAFGNFLLEQVAAGDYELQLQTLDPAAPTTVVIPDLHL
jgi:hypothetical protein